jgi:hypothetical protein
MESVTFGSGFCDDNECPYFKATKMDNYIMGAKCLKDNKNIEWYDYYLAHCEGQKKGKK